MLPWKYEVGDSDAIPGRMIKEPVPPASVINENHDHQTQPIETKSCSWKFVYQWYQSRHSKFNLHKHVKVE